MVSRSSICISTSIASLLIPLLFIGIAILQSNWFNIYRNALSDLGHATRSIAAPIFNLGLSLGGVLIIVVATHFLINISRALGVTATISGYSLILIAVFDEVYGKLHFWVSVLFFITLAILLCIYIAVFKGLIKRIAAAITLVIAVVAWILHLAAKILPGAAIPELISIIAIAPFYIDTTIKKACRI